jgi:hypothetical protein
MGEYKVKRGTCPCCGYIAHCGDGEHCGVCSWEGDTAQENEPDLTGGANGYSLRQAQARLREGGIVLPVEGARATPYGYPHDPAWSLVDDAVDLSDSPERAREVFDRRDVARLYSFAGAARRSEDPSAAIAVVARRLADLGLDKMVEHRSPGSAPMLTCSWQEEEKRLYVFFEPGPTLRFAISCVPRRVITAIGAERWGECVLRISEELEVDIARSQPLMFAPDLEDDELSGDVAFVDWVQYWSAPIVARWGLDVLRRGPFARVDAHANGAASLWLARDPYDDSMSRAAATSYLGLPLGKIYSRDGKTGPWLAVPWP